MAPKDVLRTLPELVKQFCEVYTQKLQTIRALVPAEMSQRIWRTKIVGSLGVLGVGLVTLVPSYYRSFPKPLGYGLIWLVMGLGAPISWITHLSTHQLTTQGEDYLNQLRLAFDSKKQSLSELGPEDAQYPFLVGLFGLDVLTGTAFETYRQAIADGWRIIEEEQNSGD